MAWEIVQCQDLFKFVRSLMYTTSMYSLHFDRSLPRSLSQLGILVELILEIFLYFALGHIVTLSAWTIYLNYDGGNLELVISCLMQAIIYSWAIFMKVYFRRIKQKNLVDLMDFVNSNYKTRSAIGFTYVTMQESLTISIRYTKLFVYSVFGSVIFWCLVPIIYGDRSLPLPFWYPFDYKAPVIYEIVYFLQTVGQFQIAAAFSASSCLYMVLAILLSGQYDILFCSLKNILATVAINRNAGESDLRELYGLQEFSPAEINEYYCAQEITLAIDILVRQRPKLKALNFRQQFRNELKECVDHHRYILESLEKMEKFYNLIWFFKTGEVMTVICLVAFVSVKSTTANLSFMKSVSLYQYFILVAWELLIICYFGEIVYFNSQRCGEALLRSPWYLHFDEVKKDFLLFLICSKRPFKLTAAKIFVLNVERFKNIMLTAFSFLTCLQEMDKRINS